MKRVAILMAVAAGVALAITWVADVWPFGPKWLQVVDEDGLPVARALVLVRRAGRTEADFADTADRTGWIAIPRDAIHPDTELLATAPACGIARGAVPSGGRVVLPEGIPVTFEVPGDFPLPRPPAELTLRLAPDGNGGAWSMMLAEAVAPPGYRGGDEMARPEPPVIDAETRSVKVMLPRTGRWLVEWSVMHYTIERSEGYVSRSGSGSGPAEPTTVEIAGGDAPVALPIDPAELRKHLGG